MGLQGPLGAPRDFYGPLGGPGNGMGRGCNMMLSGAGLLDSIRCPTTFFLVEFSKPTFRTMHKSLLPKKENATPRVLDSRSFLLKSHSGSNRDLSPQE